MPGEYHFIQEVREQPEAVRATLAHADAQLRDLGTRYAATIDRVVLTGCGDPYLLSQAAVYALERWAGVPAEAIEAAELSGYRHGLLTERTLLILISSSGKTVKVIEAARLAAQRGAPVLAVTNLVPSPIAAETDQIVQTQAGWSDAFSTKQTTTALALLYALALHWAEAAGTLPADTLTMLRDELYEAAPAAMAESLGQESAMRELAAANLDLPIYTFLGSGPNLATALLTAAKMKETSQSRSEAHNLEEFGHLHGLSLKDGDLVFIVTADAPIDERNRLLGRWIIANGGRLVVVGPAALREAWAPLDVAYVAVAGHDEMFGPLIAWLPLQMFAYYVAVGKERNPDRPPERGEAGYLQEFIYTSMLEGWWKR